MDRASRRAARRALGVISSISDADLPRYLTIDEARLLGDPMAAGLLCSLAEARAVADAGDFHDWGQYGCPLCLGLSHDNGCLSRRVPRPGVAGSAVEGGDGER